MIFKILTIFIVIFWTYLGNKLNTHQIWQTTPPSHISWTAKLDSYLSIQNTLQYHIPMLYWKEAFSSCKISLIIVLGKDLVFSLLNITKNTLWHQFHLFECAIFLYLIMFSELEFKYSKLWWESYGTFFSSILIILRLK